MAKLKNPVLLLCYGTLKRGFHNNRLLAEAEFICEAETVELYPMVSTGIPFLFNSPGKGHHVKGEVFQVDSAEVLARVDALEGHPNWYCRTPLKVRNGVGEVLDVQAYMIPEKELSNSRFNKRDFVAEYTKHPYARSA